MELRQISKGRIISFTKKCKNINLMFRAESVSDPIELKLTGDFNNSIKHLYIFIYIGIKSEIGTVVTDFANIKELSSILDFIKMMYYTDKLKIDNTSISHALAIYGFLRFYNYRDPNTFSVLKKTCNTLVKLNNSPIT